MPNQTYADYAPPTKSEFRVTGWVPINSGALVGKCTVELSLMRIIGVAVMRGADGTLWAAPPARPQLDGEGRVRIHTATGKRVYEPVIAWRSREIAAQFSRKVIAALRADPRIDLPDDPPPARNDGAINPAPLGP